MKFSGTEFRKLLFSFRGAPPILRSSAALAVGGVLLFAPVSAVRIFVWLGWGLLILTALMLLPGKTDGRRPGVHSYWLLLLPAAGAVWLLTVRQDQLAIHCAAFWAAVAAIGFLAAVFQEKNTVWDRVAAFLAALLSVVAAVVPPWNRAGDFLALAPWYGLYFAAIGIFTMTLRKK